MDNLETRTLDDGTKVIHETHEDGHTQRTLHRVTVRNADLEFSLPFPVIKGTREKVLEIIEAIVDLGNIEDIKANIGRLEEI